MKKVGHMLEEENRPFKMQFRSKICVVKGGKEELGEKSAVQVQENLAKSMGSIQIKVNHQRSLTFSNNLVVLICLLCACILLLLGK